MCVLPALCMWAVCIPKEVRRQDWIPRNWTYPVSCHEPFSWLFSHSSCSFGPRSVFLDLSLFPPTLDVFGSPGFFLVPFPELLVHLQAFLGFLLQDLHTSSKRGVSGITGVNLQMLMASGQAQRELGEPARLNLLTNAACQLSRVTALINSGAGILTS